MIKIAIAGACGKMGSRVFELARQNLELTVTAVFEHPLHPRVGQDYIPGFKLAGSLEPIIGLCDVVIDFTEHTASLQNLRLIAQHNKAAVIGTTGFTPPETEEIQEFGKKISMVLAPNMSVGVNLMFKVIQDMAKALGEYDIEVVEAHHRTKKDAPSGTALRMAELLAQARGNQLSDVGVYARHGHIGERKTREIGVQTVRAGDIVGDHTVIFAGPGERLELIHRAHSRDNFARGALKASLWVAHQPHGLYDMWDVMGIR